MNTMEILGLVLVLFAVLTGFGVTFGILPVLGGGITVLVGIAGTWLWIKHKGHR